MMPDMTVSSNEAMQIENDELIDRIAELEKLNQSEMDSNHRLIARNLELETKLNAVRDLCDVDGRHIGDKLVRSSEILAALNGKGHE